MCNRLRSQAALSSLINFCENDSKQVENEGREPDKGVSIEKNRSKRVECPKHEDEVQMHFHLHKPLFAFTGDFYWRQRSRQPFPFDRETAFTDERAGGFRRDAEVEVSWMNLRDSFF